jgi:hypothetical protein
VGSRVGALEAEKVSIVTEERSRPRGKGLSAATMVGLAIALLLPIPPYREPFLYLLMTGWGLSWIEAWESIGLVSKLVVDIGLPLLVVYWERRSLASIGLRALSVKDLLAMLAILLAYVVIGPQVMWLAGKVPCKRRCKTDPGSPIEN